MVCKQRATQKIKKELQPEGNIIFGQFLPLSSLTDHQGYAALIVRWNYLKSKHSIVTVFMNQSTKGNKFACLYAVDIKKYKTEIIISDNGDHYRVYWRLYYNMLSFIGWRDLKVIEEETKKIFDAFGPEKYPAAIFDKKTRLVFRLNPVYVVLTFILLAFLALDG